ncbi:MAG TPA: MFS transporter [Yinghuangia sp.]|uniref:MFS transporter n=1 Tax=Yinghuangia sp. YIM S10712 TaxID=3436930 RepID=UPI002BCFCB1F|nr:MFS transporter [Yinghuangia sp.]
MRRDGLGPDFTRLWGAYTVSAVGSAIATDAFALTAVLVLSGSAFQVSLLAAIGGAVGALVALPLGPWIEFRHKRPVMIGADVMRCCALLTLPLAYAVDALTYPHLVVVCVLTAVGQIVFVAASTSHLKGLVPREHLTAANGRFESVLWTSSAVGPPVGGLSVALFGPAATILADAGSYLLSALGIRAIAAPEPAPPPRTADRRWWQGLGAGWRHIWTDAVLRLLFANTVVVSSLIIAIAPIWAVIMLRDLHFSPFAYGLSIGIPCIAGVIGARLSRPCAARWGNRTVLLVAGVARVLWLPWLPLVGAGPLGLAAVTAIHSGTVFFTSLFTPIFATCRLEKTPHDKVARVLTSWTISNNAARATCTLAFGVLATLTAPRSAITVAVVLLVATCACLPWRMQSADDAGDRVTAPTSRTIGRVRRQGSR